MQLLASVGLIVVGLLLALILSSSADMRIFGWILAGVGALGLLSRAWLARQPRRRR